MTRTARAPHSHLTQTDDIVPDCPACALIRPAAMTRNYGLIIGGLLGPVPEPEDPS